MTPYFRYMMEIRPELVAKNPGKHITDIIRMVGKSWEKVDEATKCKLEGEYKKDKELFEKELVKYESQLTPQMKADLLAVRHDRTERRARLTLKKRNKELGKPKRAPSSFLQFASAERSTNPPTAKENTASYIKRLGAKWRTLSEAQKKPYVEAAAKGLAQYKVDMERWEARMIKEGNVDVIRNPLFDGQTPKKPASAPKTPNPSRKSSEWEFGCLHSEEREIKRISSVNDSKSRDNNNLQAVNVEFTQKSPPQTVLKSPPKIEKSSNTADGDTSDSQSSDKIKTIDSNSRFSDNSPNLDDKKTMKKHKNEESKDDKSKKDIFTKIKNIFKFWTNFFLIIIDSILYWKN